MGIMKRDCGEEERVMGGLCVWSLASLVVDVVVEISDGRFLIDILRLGDLDVLLIL